MIQLQIQAAVIYVDIDAPAGGDGSTWASAYKYLQDALGQTVAGQGDEVWIADGTYYPDDGASVAEGDRRASFALKDGVALYGGFQGTESSLSERDLDAHVTTLSGKIYTEQIYWSIHVCTVIDGGTIRFDGLTVTGGNANGTGTGEDRAAAVYSASSNYQVKAANSSFSHHSATYGGVASDGSWAVTKSSFSNNSTNTGGVAYSGTWTVTRCSFNENSVSRNSGVADGGIWTVTSCTFNGNSAGRNSGVADGGIWTVTSCSFNGNSAGRDGGVAVGGTWIVTNSSFSGNSAGLGGGVANNGTWTVTSSSFSDNTADYGGVGVSGTWILTSSSFSRNFAGDLGSVGYYSDWTVANNIFDATNTSPSSSLFARMGRFQNTLDSAPDPTSPRSKNIIQGGLDVIDMRTEGILNVGTGFIIDADPLFVDATNPAGSDSVFGTADDGLRLQSGSPAIGEGNAELLPADDFDLDNDGVTDEPISIDLAGFLRVQGGALDLGAYEFGDETALLINLIVETTMGGTTSPSGLSSHSPESEVTITATNNPGYVFEEWTGDIKSVDSQLSLIMDQAYQLTAVFGPDLADDDGDGLTNYQEIITYKTDPNLKDSSGDDLSDGDVVNAGFDPTKDFSSLLSVMGQRMEDARTGSTMIDTDGSNVLLRLQIERSSDLSIWSEDPEDIIEIEIPLSGDNSFFRFAIPSEN